MNIHDFFVNINPSGAVTFENMSGPLLNMFNYPLLQENAII